MVENKKFYISTAIDYPNSKPHLGHAYEKLCADVIARWKKMEGYEVFFLTGTDEHGLKIQRTAEKANLKPKEFVDQQVLFFKELCQKWNINYSRFIRTTDQDHEQTVSELFEKVYKKGDIYLDQYTGLYCTDCETFYLEKDLKNGLCKMHGKKCEQLSEESYFFKMSKYEKQVREYLAKKDTILPDGKADEVINRMKGGLKDLSVSRTTFTWGIPLPINSKHTQYVWFDALINYLSGIGFIENKKQFEKFWPADIHLIGTDIAWHHTVIWYSMLLAMELELPKTVFVHGFINTASGEKMSKSKGNVIDPIQLTEKYPIDSIRYYLIREIPFGQDGYFSEELLIERHNQELGNELGNLVYRTLSMAEKYFQGKIETTKINQQFSSKNTHLKQAHEHMNKLELHMALGSVLGYVKELNKYISDSEPWKKEKKEQMEILGNLVYGLKTLTSYLWPFMPQTAENIAVQLGCTVELFTELEKEKPKFEQLTKGKILFEKMEYIKPELPPIEFSAEKGIPKEDIGVIIEITGLKVQTRSMELERMKKELMKKGKWKTLENAKHMKEYLEFMKVKDKQTGKPAPHNLLEIISKNQRIPTIDSVTDCYNLKSIEHGIVMGAYDRNGIKGNLHLKIANGSEYFVTIGSIQPEKIFLKEFVYCDDENRVVTRIVSKQADYVKVTKDTEHIVLNIQGNKEISREKLIKIAQETAELIVKINGGKYKILNP
ncbi:MAG: methionine--tRNA ligase [Candidatus Diapherotrites archaeon]|nr:methionine--tRNA ligase [Candidatus Diapherotrites archaeon]